jgi:uncharacterized phage protein gp47/JayE
VSYAAPSINSSGLTISSYSDIRDYLIEQAQSIYGSDIYLEEDSQDYQLISAFALLAHDTLNGVQLAYNSFGASTVIGSAQDALYKINGISRKAASYSTCDVTLTGTAGTVITNGKVQDTSGYYWDLPSSITIGSSGTLTTSVTCETIGSITALAGTLNIIATPTAGWTSVTNSAAAIAGTAQETDSAFRSRQALSTENPSQGLVDGTAGGIAGVADVTRVRVYENDTDEIDSNTLPAHSIAAVVEGGTISDIAYEIYYRKTPGCYTYGTTSTEITDLFGNINTIRFFRPTDVPIYVIVNLKKLTGYTTSLATDIQTAIANYLNSLAIGTDVTASALWYEAVSVISDLKSPTFSITSIYIGTSADPTTSADITIAFSELSQGDTTKITVNAS